MVIIIGILALQGNFKQHSHILNDLGANSIYVRYPKDLDECDGLIIPGGESTSMSIQMDRTGFRKAIKKFSQIKSVFGTCAGMIMLSSNSQSNNLEPLCLMDFCVERNGWGRQLHSFNVHVNLNWENGKPFNAIFIRAPKITRYSKSVKVLADVNGEPVLVQKNKFLASTFHPELVEDYRVHQYFIDMING